MHVARRGTLFSSYYLSFHPTAMCMQHERASIAYVQHTPEYITTREEKMNEAHCEKKNVECTPTSTIESGLSALDDTRTSNKHAVKNELKASSARGQQPEKACTSRVSATSEAGIYHSGS